MSYREYPPSMPLRQYVDCYWYYTSDQVSREEDIPVQRCLPLGTVEIIMQVDQKPCRILNEAGVWEESPCIYVTGLFTDTALWQPAPGTIMFGIRLKPESVMELFRVPAVHLLNSVVNAEDVLGSVAKDMCREMTGIFDFQTLVVIAEKLLLNRLHDLKQDNNLVSMACRMIRQAKGGITVEELSDSLYVTKRKLQRDFKELFGASPKTYQRIVRFRHAYQYARCLVSNAIKWTDVSYEAGYADQAHFIREFREFTGLPPSTLTTNTEHFFQTLEACRFNYHNA